MIKDIIEVLFEMSVSDLSSVVTIRNVIEECHGIMLIQVVDSIYKSTRANLAWDKTSITEVHVRTDVVACVKAPRPLEGGTANDHQNHTKLFWGKPLSCMQMLMEW